MRYLLAFVVILFVCLLFVKTKEGYMDSELIAIQNDFIQQKSNLDKQVKALAQLIDDDPEKQFVLESILKKMTNKLQTLIADGKPENVDLIKQLKALKEKTEKIPPSVKLYKDELKKFSDSKIEEKVSVKSFLPNLQKLMDDIKKDIQTILKD